MDQYTEVAKNNVVLPYKVLVSDYQRPHNDDNLIVMLPNVLGTCPLKDELRATLEKRLRSKRRTGSGPDAVMVALMCIASRDYSVSHISLKDITDREMYKIWGLLERVSTSSSYQLRQWITPLLNSRTCEGYMGYWGTSRTFAATQKPSSVTQTPWKHCLDVTKDMAYKLHGQPETVYAACYADLSSVIGLSALISGHVIDVPIPQ